MSFARALMPALVPIMTCLVFLERRMVSTMYHGSLCIGLMKSYNIVATLFRTFVMKELARSSTTTHTSRLACECLLQCHCCARRGGCLLNRIRSGSSLSSVPTICLPACLPACVHRYVRHDWVLWRVMGLKAPRNLLSFVSSHSTLKRSAPCSS
jgi:hypothetical protein